MDMTDWWKMLSNFRYFYSFLLQKINRIHFYYESEYGWPIKIWDLFLVRDQV